MKQLLSADAAKLQDFASTTILSNVKDKLSRMSIDASTDEIMSEIWNQYAYLVNNYRTGSLSLTSYCYKYAEQRTVEAFRQARDRNRRRVEIDLDGIGTNNYNPTRELIEKEREMNAMELDDNTVILNPRLIEVLKAMRGDDLQMAKMYVSGISLEKIGKYFGISGMAVLKRLRKYGDATGLK